ncbi:MAG: SIS domain-containing protein [Opitutae bacterium]|jgi:D-sedoheptulose 7-phosphate isomerase|nr:SIS domain-containing protein [Opitutae bacterium]
MTKLRRLVKSRLRNVLALADKKPIVSIVQDIDNLLERRPELASCRQDIARACEAMLTCFRSGNQVLLCGNGGSAADCEHIAGELVKRFSRPRPLAPELAEKLGPDLADNLHGALPALSLPSMVGFTTAFVNDDEPEYAFAQQVVAFGKPGDLLLAISTSGNSKNVIHAAKAAKALGLGTIGLTGQGGGQLGSICETMIQVPANEVPRVQELHLPVYHTLCQVVEDTLFP